MQKLKTDLEISQLRFLGDSQYVETDRGGLHLQSNPAVRSIAPEAGNIHLSGGWITGDAENLLWLPHDYRGRCSAFEGNLLVIRQGSGPIHFIEFNPTSAII